MLCQSVMNLGRHLEDGMNDGQRQGMNEWKENDDGEGTEGVCWRRWEVNSKQSPYSPYRQSCTLAFINTYRAREFMLMFPMLLCATRQELAVNSNMLQGHWGIVSQDAPNVLTCQHSLLMMCMQQLAKSSIQGVSAVAFKETRCYSCNVCYWSRNVFDVKITWGVGDPLRSGYKYDSYNYPCALSWFNVSLTTKCIKDSWYRRMFCLSRLV